MRNKFVFASIIVLFISLVSFSQENDLDPVTVTASFNPVRVSATGRNLIVIKGERFEQLPVYSLDELLRYIPGIELQARGPFGSQSDITMRGGTFQQVLVIIDGVRVNDANTGHFTSYIPIAATEIDRIEILKGASSALYGSDAVGGVIHIITKTFAAKKDIKSESQFTRLAIGEYKTLVADIGMNKNTGTTAFGFGAHYIETKGQQQRGIRGFLEGENVTASFSHYFGNDIQLSLRAAYDKREFAAQNFYTSFLSDTAQETVTTFWNQLQLVKYGANNTWRLQVGYKNLKDSFAFNKISATNQNRSELWQALLTHEARLGDKTSITPGVQFMNKKISSNDRGYHSVNLAAAFFILNQQFGEKFFLSPSARLEWNKRAGWEAVPQIALSYRTKKFQLRSSAGKTIRDADFTERFNNYNKIIVTSGQRLGNPDLEVERSWSYEAGADYFAGNSLKLSSTYFQRFHNDLIDYVSTPYAQIPRKENLITTGTYAFARNIAEVTTTGFETDIQFSKNFKNNHIWATFGLIWLKSRSSDTVPSLYISSHAKFLANLALRYSHKGFAVSVTSIYKKRQPQKAASALIAPVSSDYIIFNAKAEVFIWKELSAFAEMDNITDRSYADLLGSQMPGRWFTAGIQISLSK
jgi:vitamin B12 transporter